MKRISFLSLVSIILCLGTSAVWADGFNPNPPADPGFDGYEYLTTVKVYPENAGDASGSGKYKVGNTVWLSVSCHSGYEFDHWEKDGVRYSGDQYNASYVQQEEKPVFVAILKYNPQAPSDPSDNYQPKKRLYLECDQKGVCSFNMTSGDKVIVGQEITVIATLSPGYVVKGWYIGDSLVSVFSGFTFEMPSCDQTLTVKVEYRPKTPNDPDSQGGNIAMEPDNLDDIDPMVENALFYFEGSKVVYTGNPAILGFSSRYNPVVHFQKECAVNVGSYYVDADVSIQNDSMSTQRTFRLYYEILPVELNVSVGNYSKVYGDENPAFEPVVTGFVNGEDNTVLTRNVELTTSATVSSGVGEYPITASGAKADNYTFNYTDGILTVTPAELSVSVGNYSKTYGEENPEFEASVTGFVNGEDQRIFTKAVVYTTDASKSSGVGNYSVTASGAEAVNYSIAYVPGTLMVYPANLTISAGSYKRMYGNENPPFEPVFSGFVNGDTKSVLTKDVEFVTTATTSSRVGEYAVNVSGAEASDYNISYVEGTLKIEPAELTVTANSASYNFASEQFYLSYDISGFVNGDDISVLYSLPSVECEAKPGSAPGKYVITVSGASAGNYYFKYVNGELTLYDPSLEPHSLDEIDPYTENNMFVFKNTQMTYSGQPFILDYFSLYEPVVTVPAELETNAGSYSIDIEVSIQTESISTVKTFTFIYEILPVELNVSVGNYSKVYGDGNPAFEPVVTGFVNGEDRSVLTKDVEFETFATKASGVGRYTVTATGAEALNYTFAYTDGMLEITPAMLTVTADDAEYDIYDTGQVYTYSITGFVNGDDESVLTVKPAVYCESAGGAGKYVLVVSGAEAANYLFEYVNGTLTLIDTAVGMITDDTVCPVYDLTGRFIGNIRVTELPQGMYIINKRKVAVE